MEKELLFLLSRVQPDSSALEKARTLINPTNWDFFTSLSIKYGTSAIIYKNLLKLTDIPQGIINKFEGIYNNSLRSNILIVSELDRIIEGLSKRGIEVISLKGATASEKIFGDIALYPSGDIDILVKVKDIDSVMKFLDSGGYKLNDVSFDEYREFFIKELYHINLSNDRYTIEPHWNLFFRYFTTPSEFWWEESIAVSSGGKQYRFLSPEKNILYTAFRLFSKGFTHLRFLVMVAEVVRYYHNIVDWEKLFAYAKEYKFENTLRLVMRLCHEFLGAPVPQQYTDITSLRAKVIYSRAGEMVLIEEDIHPLDKALFTFLRDDVMGTVSVLLRRLFPSMGEIVSRYRLTAGSGKAFAYYILNPIMLLKIKHQNAKESKVQIL